MQNMKDKMNKNHSAHKQTGSLTINKHNLSVYGKTTADFKC